jgi:hypothetical protein
VVPTSGGTDEWGPEASPRGTQRGYDTWPRSDSGGRQCDARGGADMTESAQGRPPVDETRPSAPDQDAGSSVPADTGVGMGRGEADTFEPEESQPADED